MSGSTVPHKPTCAWVTGDGACTCREPAQETRLVEYACRHRDILSRPLYGYWLDTTDHCGVCDKHRKIVWTDDDA